MISGINNPVTNFDAKVNKSGQERGEEKEEVLNILTTLPSCLPVSSFYCLYTNNTRGLLPTNRALPIST